MTRALDRFFKLSERHTSVRVEVTAGLTTFLTMAYIIVVNPAILRFAGLPFGPSTVATILVAVFGCLLMGLYANRPLRAATLMAGLVSVMPLTPVKMLVTRRSSPSASRTR